MSFQIGVAGASVVPRDPARIDKRFAAQLAEYDVEVLVAHFGSMDDHTAARVRDVLGEHGIRIVQLAGYRPNFVQPDDAVRSESLFGLRHALRSARTVGADMFLTGCGSLSTTSFYGPHPENHTAETRRRLVLGLAEAAVLAEDAQVPLVLECHLLTTLDTPTHIAEVLDAVGSRWVRANFDPVNLIGDLPTAYDTGTAMREMARVIGDHYVSVAHVKDVAVRVDELPLHLAEVPPGEGLLDMNAFLDVSAGLGEDTALVVEHLDAEQVPAALAFLRTAIRKWGRAPA